VSATGADAPVLEVRGLAWAYGAGRSRVQVLHGVSLDVAAGEVVALVGPSGSGKSTVCHVVSGLEPLPPGVGEVAVLGEPPAGHRDWSRVAVVPQQHGLVPGLSVRDNVALPALRAGLPAAVVDAALAALDLTALARHEVTATSLGEQQRTAIARALVLSPRLLVLDEPSGHQDAAHVDLLVAALRGAAGAGTAVLVATHDDDLIEAADRVVRLADGRVVAG
jgi:putative ABC transport system ATP-binding protein